MLLDIFSSFDPACNNLFSLSPTLFWMPPITLYLLFSSFWTMPNQITFGWALPINTLSPQTTHTSTLHLKGLSSILIPLFMILITINLLGLLPYMFSTSSHIIFTLTFALPLWFFMIISSMTKNLSSFTANLMPSGAPGWLNTFLLNVEMLSILARPITLSFRLAANMSTGHIVLTLITSYLTLSFFSTSFIYMLSLLLTATLYTLFEMGICLMQAYIFCLLLTLYSNEHAH